MDLSAAVRLSTAVRTWAVRATYAVDAATAADCAAAARALLPELADALSAVDAPGPSAADVLDTASNGRARLPVPEAAKEAQKPERNRRRR